MKEPLGSHKFELAFFLMAVLLAVLALIAVLQHVWSGEVSDAERQRFKHERTENL